MNNETPSKGALCAARNLWKGYITLENDARIIDSHTNAIADELAEALEELSALMKDVIGGEYKPDSFTLQPSSKALARYQQIKAKETS